MRSYFSILTRWDNEIRPYSIEGEVPETAAEVRHAISQFGRGQSLFKVMRIDIDECLAIDVTEDFIEAEETYIPGAYDKARDELEAANV